MMKQLILILTCILTCQHLFAQKDTVIYYPSGKIAKKGKIVNGKLNGPYSEYYENGKIKYKAIVLNGLPNGKVEIFDEFGEKKIETEYNNGVELPEKIKQYNSLDDQFYLYLSNSSGKFGLERKSDGRNILPAEYDAILKKDKNYYTLIKKQKYYGLMHKSGNIVVNAMYDEEISYSSEHPFPVKKNGKYGYLNPEGKVITPFEFDYAGSMKMNNCFGTVTASIEVDNKWGVIEKTGKIIIPAIYESLKCSEGILVAEMNGKYGLIDRYGKVTVAFTYDHIGEFSEGLAAVKLNNKYGYIDKTGKLVIPIKYLYAGKFNNGKANVQLDPVSLTDSEAQSENRGSIIAEKNAVLNFYIDKTGKRVD